MKKNLQLISYQRFGGAFVAVIMALTTLVAGGPDLDLEVAGSAVSLACNDNVHVSLDGNCEAELNADMLLDGQQFPNNAYTVDVYRPDGTLIPNATLTGDHIGLQMEYHVTLNSTGETCWGYVYAHDKLIPALPCRDTTILAMCGEGITPEIVGFPLPMGFGYVPGPNQNEYIVTGYDPCGSATLIYRDEVVGGACDQRYFQVIERTWFATDESGNSTSCMEVIAVERGTLANVMWPPNYDDFDRPALECDFRDVVTKSQPIGGVNVGWNSLGNGFPNPKEEVLSVADTLIGTGFPSGVECDHLVVTYTDRKIETCGPNTYKLFRTWRIFDWCTGEDTAHIQSIKVVDTRAPEVLCPSRTPVIVPTTPWECTGTFIVPDPIFDPYFRGTPTVPVVLKECNSFTYEVRHKIASVGTMSPDDCAAVDENATFFTTNVRQLPDGRYEVFDMPQGCNWIKYIITDDCGNEVICGMELFVADTENPVAVCDEHTVVGLNESGEAELCAINVDNGSQDNCTEHDSLNFEIKRMNEHDSLFRECIEFTCLDINISPIMVIFRVYDKAGNYNDCMVEVSIQDKIAPTIECPDDIEISCSEDYLDDSVTGIPNVIDQCGIGTLTSSIVFEDLNDCNIGYVIKRWRVEDLGGRWAVCDQRIDLVDYDVFEEEDINWPEDYTLDGCEVIEAHPNTLPLGYGWPTYDNVDCAKPAAGFEDDIFYDANGYCIKIIRTWEVIDWCQYDTRRGGPKWVNTQTIYISNSEAPTILSGCDDQVLCAENDCEGLVEFELEASDDCTPAEDLLWSYRIRDIHTGDIIETGLGNTYNDVLPVGQYRFTWTVRDGCSNESSCNSDVRVEDCKEPTPYCKPGIITTIMPSTGYVEIWASDFNDGSFDNCTDTSDLVFSFSDNTRDQFRTIYCSDIANGVVDTFTYEMWVTDNDGNQDFCIVTIIVQDNQDRCPDTGNLTANVGGLISTIDDQEVALVGVDLMHESLFTSDMLTGDDGHFAFSDLTMEENYSVIPHKNDDQLNGVSTADIVMIQRHLLGKAEITSPYKLIAADANNSESVSASDIAELRKLILGVYTELPRNTSWRFVDAASSFSNSNDPWVDPLKELIIFNEIKEDKMESHFVGIKIGDVTGDVVANSKGGNQTRTNANISLVIDEETYYTNDEVVIDFRLSDQATLYGVQATIEYTSLTDVSLRAGAMGLSEGNYFVNENDNVITFTWSADELEAFEAGDVVFTLIGKADQKVATDESIILSSRVTRAEAYMEGLEVASLTLEVEGQTDNTGIALYQNIPNPFTSSTVIPFELSEQAPATLTIFDVTGKVQLVVYLEGQKGYNEFELNTDKLTKAGVLYYQLESNHAVATKRMLMIK